MSDERQHATLFELLRWGLPTVLVLLGVIAYFIYVDAAPAIGAGAPLP
ncbi:MAG TPA: hypothetical protein VF454_00340 [Gemmatimonadales bacterium]